jgi:hypothetical protein
VPAVGTSASSVNLSTVPETRAYGTGWAVPHKASKPSWFTTALQERTPPGTPVQAPPDAPLPSEVGIRPGAWVIAPYGCTMNFVFTKSSRYAIGAAGHCVDKVGDTVTLVTLAPGTENPVLVDIGQVIARHENGIGDDFALVSIRPELNEWVFPTTAVIGGRAGNASGQGPGPCGTTATGWRSGPAARRGQGRRSPGRPTRSDGTAPRSSATPAARCG